MVANSEQAAALLLSLKGSPTPPWRKMASRDLARQLGVSLQVLANWRVRGCGPRPEPHRRGEGNRTYYKRSAVIQWLSANAGQPRPEWEHERDWLVRFSMMDGQPSEEEVAVAVSHLAPLKL
jgi:phage terminase Nu1 subunit (DNA packaging protein)